jgi:hypothetical protein
VLLCSGFRSTNISLKMNDVSIEYLQANEKESGGQRHIKA